MTVESFLEKREVIKGLDNPCFPAFVEQSIPGSLPLEFYVGYNRLAQRISRWGETGVLCQAVVDAAFPDIPKDQREIAWRHVGDEGLLREILAVCRENNYNVGIFTSPDHIVKINPTEDPDKWEVLLWYKSKKKIELSMETHSIRKIFKMMTQEGTPRESPDNLVVLPAAA